jgi:hypothetical protein
MRIGIVCALMLLSGCATSAAGLMKGKVEQSWTSDKAPQQLAGCLASKLIGTNPVFQDESGHYVVVRNNSYGIPITRYDIYAVGGRTTVELRSSLSLNKGADKLETCL